MTFVSGDRFTMADIPIACEVHRYWSLPREHTPHANIERWYAAMIARPQTRGLLDLPLA